MRRNKILIIISSCLLALPTIVGAVLQILEIELLWVRILSVVMMVAGGLIFTLLKSKEKTELTSDVRKGVFSLDYSKIIDERCQTALTYIWELDSGDLENIAAERTRLYLYVDGRRENRIETTIPHELGIEGIIALLDTLTGEIGFYHSEIFNSRYMIPPFIYLKPNDGNKRTVIYANGKFSYAVRKHLKQREILKNECSIS